MVARGHRCPKVRATTFGWLRLSPLTMIWEPWYGDYGCRLYKVHYKHIAWIYSTRYVIQYTCASSDLCHRSHFGSRYHIATCYSQSLFVLPRSHLCGSCKRASSTLRASQAVPHPSTDRALQRLTSEFGRDPVYSLRYGR